MHTQQCDTAGDAYHNATLQETALRSESQLESTRRSLIELDEDKQAGKEEAESARYADTCHDMQWHIPMTACQAHTIY